MDSPKYAYICDGKACGDECPGYDFDNCSQQYIRRCFYTTKPEHSITIQNGEVPVMEAFAYGFYVEKREVKND